MSVKCSREEGFTVAELMIGLAVAGITLTMGVPGFTDFVANQTQTTATNEIVTAMTLARSEAIKRNAYVTVCRSRDGVQCSGGSDEWHNGWIVFANTSQDNAATLDADETLLRYFDRRGDKRTIEPNVAGLDFVAFRPTGTVTTSAVWVLCDKRGADHARAVFVDRAGRARALPPHGDDPDSDEDDLVPGALCSTGA